MSEVEIINQTPVSISYVKEYLEKLKKDKKELNFRENKVEEYLQGFEILKFKDVEALKKEIESLNVSRLKDKQITKIIDLMPSDSEAIKVILSGENLTLKQEDLTKIEATVKKYV